MLLFLLACKPPPVDFDAYPDPGDWLRGIHDSAPYLHDGSAATLTQVFTINTADLHGGSPRRHQRALPVRAGGSERLPAVPGVATPRS